METRKYLGITIGPIIETISYSSKPAGLWFASYFFSTITRDICFEAKRKGFDILTVPMDFFDKSKDENSDDGIGTFHDRIYAKVPKEKETCNLINIVKDEIIEPVIANKTEELATALKMGKENNELRTVSVKEFLDEYLQVHFIILDISDTEPLARTLAKALDAIECSQTTLSRGKKNYFLDIVNDNECIKNYKPFQNASMLQVKGKKDKVKTILSISSNGKVNDENAFGLNKYEKYFAIVQADGDKMGNVVGVDVNGKEVPLDVQENRIRKFSELCMKYTKESSSIIKKYGGTVIYAGGDDLLFLAPIVGEEKNIWCVCNEIALKFDEIFAAYCNEKNADEKILGDKKNIIMPSVSFGVSLNYYKFPLYEAFIDARNLLFSEAKRFSQNSFAINLHKASGQSAGYVCWMDTKQKNTSQNEGGNKENTSFFEKLIEAMNKDYIDNKEDNDVILHSFLYQIENKKALFELAFYDDVKREMFFKNMFDDEHIKKSIGKTEYVNDIKIISDDIAQKNIAIKGLNSEAGNERTSAFINILRVAKFLAEEGE